MTDFERYIYMTLGLIFGKGTQDKDILSVEELKIVVKWIDKYYQDNEQK